MNILKLKLMTFSIFIAIDYEFEKKNHFNNICFQKKLKRNIYAILKQNTTFFSL